MTLGLEKLETSHRGTGVYRGLTWMIDSFPKKKSYEFTLNEKRHEDILLESLRTNFNQLKDYTDDQVAFLDCRDMHDPGKDKSTRDHLGTYPPNIHDMILNPRKSHKWMKFARK